MEIRATSPLTPPGGTLLAPASGFRLRPTNDVQGLLKGTDSPTDPASRGFFVVDGGADDRGVRYTRSGSFRPDNQGFLVNDAGYRLLAYSIDGAVAVYGLHIDRSEAADETVEERVDITR